MLLKMHTAEVLNKWSKSGSIVCKYENGKTIAVKIRASIGCIGEIQIFFSQYLMILFNWTPVVDDEGKLITVFGPRQKKFDSDLVEPGPPAMLTEKGIVLIYNSRNVPSKGDTSLAEGTYAASQILV